MAVSNISKISLVLRHKTGVAQTSFNNIKVTATDQQIYDTALAIAGLLQNATTGFQKVKEELITEN